MKTQLIIFQSTDWFSCIPGCRNEITVNAEVGTKLSEIVKNIPGLPGKKLYIGEREISPDFEIEEDRFGGSLIITSDIIFPKGECYNLI